MTRRRRSPWTRRTLVLLSVTGLILAGSLDLLLRTGVVLALVGVLALVHRPPRSTATVRPEGSGRQPWLRLQAELERARRHSRPLVLASLPYHGSPGPGERLQLDRDLRPLLRATDVTWVERGSLMLMLPEASVAQARPGIERVAEVLGDRTRVHDARVVAFPKDGVTPDALYRALLHPADHRLVVPRQRPDAEDSAGNVDGAMGTAS